MNFTSHRIFIIATALASLSFATFGQNVIFTTVDDFTGWTGSGFSLSTVTSPDLDGLGINGMGNTTQAGGSGTAGSLRLFETNPFNGSALALGPNQKTNSAFMSTLLSSGSATLRYETVPSSDEASLQILLAWKFSSTGGAGGVAPISTTFNGNIATSTYDLHGLQGGPDWFQLGISTFNNYDPSSPIYIDSITFGPPIPEPTSRALVSIGLIGLGMRSRLRR